MNLGLNFILMFDVTRETMLITWVLFPVYLPLIYGNIFEIIEKSNRPMYVKHVNHVLKYFDKSKGLYVFYQEKECHKYDTNNVIKSLREETIVFEMTKVFTVYNNAIDLNVKYNILYIGLILGEWNRTFLGEFIKIRECIILINSREELEDFVTKYSKVCVRIFLLTAQGEFFNKEYTKIIQIKNRNYFKQNLNLNKNIISYLNNYLMGFKLNSKDTVFIKLIEFKLNATVKVVSLLGDLTLSHVKMSYREHYISYPYKIQKYCYVVRKSDLLPVPQSLLQSVTVWILLIWTVITCSGICGQNPLSLLIRFFEKYIFNNYRILPARNIIETNHFMRISLASLLMSSIVIITGFQAIYFSIIHSPLRAPQINNINMLRDLNYTIYCFHHNDCLRFHKFDKSLNFNQGINRNLSIFYNHAESKIALLLYCELAKKQILSHPFHSHLLHIMNEEHGSYPIYLVYKWNFHFNWEIVRLLQSISENGIFKHVEEFDQWMVNFQKAIHMKIEPPPIILFMHEFLGALFILVFGCSISFVVFLLELLFNKLAKLFL